MATLNFSSNDTLRKTDYGNRPNLKRHIKHLVSLLHFMADTWGHDSLAELIHADNSVAWSCRNPQTTQSASSEHLTFPNILSGIRLHHWQTCSYLTMTDCAAVEALWVRMCNGNSLILTLLFHSEYETCLPSKAVCSEGFHLPPLTWHSYEVKVTESAALSVKITYNVYKAC